MAQIKTVRELINEADAKGYDVSITDDEADWSRQFDGKGWFVWGEGPGWTHDEHAFDALPVVKVQEYPQYKELFITVRGEGE